MACMIRGSSLEIVIGRPALTEARHPLLLFGREIRRLQQIPPPLPCPPDGHDALPALDPGMVPGAQDVRYHPLREYLGARVLRMLEKPARERVPGRGGLVAEGAGA